VKETIVSHTFILQLSLRFIVLKVGGMSRELGFYFRARIWIKYDFPFFPTLFNK